MRSLSLLSGLSCLALLLAAGACDEAEGRREFGSTSSHLEGEPSGTLVVFAAASLTDVFLRLEKDFENQYPGVDIKLNFAGSQSLRTQIQNGARAQIFASANPQHMSALREQELVEQPTDFAKNELVIVVPTNNPAGIESLQDLPKAQRLVLAGENVPAGVYAKQVLDSARAAYGNDFGKGIKSSIVSRETNVRQTLQKVILGEADAAMVYATDAHAAGDKVKTIAIPSEHQVEVTYPIATLQGAKQAHLGKLFIAYLSSETGIMRLNEAAFSPANETEG